MPVPTVNRLSTVAVDAAIAQGPALFVTPNLVFALLEYRQRIETLNQLIDNAVSLQQAPEFWKRPLDEDLLRHFALATAWIHLVGIGTNDFTRGHGDGAHRFYIRLRTEIEREIAIGGRPWWWWWFLVGRREPRRSREKLVEVVQDPSRGGSD